MLNCLTYKRDFALLRFCVVHARNSNDVTTRGAAEMKLRSCVKGVVWLWISEQIILIPHLHYFFSFVIISERPNDVVTCKTWGGGSFISFDGTPFYFPGRCRYTLVETAAFSVDLETEHQCRSRPCNLAVFIKWVSYIILESIKGNLY